MIAGCNFARLTRYTVSRGVWGVVLSGVLVSGSCWLSAADDAPAAGLRGILPSSVPADLTATITDLPDNWKDWGTALTAELTTLYETENVDVPSQRKALSSLRARLDTVNKHAADPRYKTILPKLVTISGELKRRLDLAEAALDTLERGPDSRTAKIDEARKQVVQTSQALETYLGNMGNGSGWVKYVRIAEIRDAVGGDPEQAAAKLAPVQTRLKDKNSLADAKSRDFLARPEFAAYENAVDGYLAALATPSVQANSPELRKNLTELLNAIESYEADHSSANAVAARKAFEAVRATAPDGGERISAALRNNYFNYNLRVIASEAFLNKLAGESRDETGPVVDFILGANVTGNQFTHTNVTIDLVPSGRNVQFDIKATGNVSSSTQGVTSQATVYTQGNHVFTAAKRIVFDGDKFWTQPARIGISANNTTTGADTNVPVFRRLADNIAVKRAEELRGESEAIAASRLHDRVLPQFNSDVDKQFGPNSKINVDFNDRMSALRELNLYPDAKSWSTTDSDLKVATRLMGPNELAANDPNPALVLGRGATVLVHESLMNASADRLEIAGQTLTEDDVRAKIEGNLTRLLGREVKFKDDRPAPSEDETGLRSFIFDKVDPIRVQVSDGTLVLTLRTGFKQEGKEDIPTQIINLPMTFSVDVKNVVIEPGKVSIASAEPPESAAKQLARAGVIKKKIESTFPRREIDRVSYVTRDKKKVLVAVTRIRALDGWLSITYE
jgi:hypothetical protein